MFTDPGTYFVGGGVVEAGPAFSQWFLNQVQAHTTLRAEQQRVVEFALVPDLDMAGARGAALAARAAVAGPRIELLRGRSAVLPASARVDPGVARCVPVP